MWNEKDGGVMKKIICIVLILVMSFSLYGCFYRAYLGKRPSDQPGTEWVSEDGSIIMRSVDNVVVGTMTFDDKVIDVHITNDSPTGTWLYLYPASVLDEGVIITSPYEKWSCSYKSKEKFVATVKETTFFEEGQTITFRRVDSVMAE